MNQYHPLVIYAIVMCNGLLVYADEKIITKGEVIKHLRSSIESVSYGAQSTIANNKHDNPFIIDNAHEAKTLFNTIDIPDIVTNIMPDDISVNAIGMEKQYLLNMLKINIHYDNIELATMKIKRSIYNVILWSKYLNNTTPISQAKYEQIVSSIQPLIDRCRKILHDYLDSTIKPQRIDNKINQLEMSIKQCARIRLIKSLHCPLPLHKIDEIADALETKLISSIKSIKLARVASQNAPFGYGINSDYIIFQLIRFIQGKIFDSTKNESIININKEALCPGYSALNAEISRLRRELRKIIAAQRDAKTGKRQPVSKRYSHDSHEPALSDEEKKSLNREYRKALRELGIVETDNAEPTEDNADHIRRQDPRQPSGFNYAN